MGTGLFFVFEKQIKETFYPVKTIHVFYDGLATQPAFMGMIDMLQLPKEDVKIFAWHRFTKRSELIDLNEINAVEVPVIDLEGYGLVNVDPVLDKLKETMDRYPNSPVIVWTNANNINYFFDLFFKKIDYRRVKHIHLYEDGVGELFTQSQKYKEFSYQDKDIQNMRAYWFDSNSKVKFPSNGRYLIHHFFPVTYHFYKVETAMKDPSFSSFFKAMEGAEFEDSDFIKIKNKLTQKQKEMLYKFLNFDEKRYKDIFNNHKTFMFVSGYYHKNVHHLDHAEISYIIQLMKKYPDYYFFLKPHPSFDAFDKAKYMTENFKNMEIINAQLPYEIFVIAGIEPDKIAGRTSSLFFSVTDEMVEGFFEYSLYTKGLQKIIHLSDAKKEDPDNFVPLLPYFYDEKIIINEKEDFLIFTSNGTAFLYNAKKKMGFKKMTGGLILIEWDGGSSYYQKNEEGIYQKTNNPYLFLHHAYWKDTLTLKKGNVFCRPNNDCGQVETNQKNLKMCWDNWGCEEYFLNEDGSYHLKQ